MPSASISVMFSASSIAFVRLRWKLAPALSHVAVDRRLQAAELADARAIRVALRERGAGERTRRQTHMKPKSSCSFARRPAVLVPTSGRYETVISLPAARRARTVCLPSRSFHAQCEFGLQA